MKTKNLLLIGPVLLITTGMQAQHLTRDQVPPAVVAAFEQADPKALDVVWKQKGTQYKVDYETGLFRNDHEAWYDAEGRLLRQEDEMAASDLPAAVQQAIAKEFAGFRTDDVKRITEQGVATWVVELQNGPTEWKVAYDANGKQLQKLAD